MNNREKLKNALKTISPELKEKIDYRLEQNQIEESDEFDLSDAFDDVIELDMENGKKITNEVKEILIAIGFVEPVDLQNTYVSSGKKYWFTRNRIPYDVVSAWSIWIEK